MATTRFLIAFCLASAHIASDASEETLIKRALENAVHSGDLSRMALEHASNDRLSRVSRQTIIRKAQSSISNLVLLIADVENRTKGVAPFLSMGVDFVANSAPIPGLN